MTKWLDDMEAPTAKELITYLKEEYNPKEKLMGVYYFYNKSEVEEIFLGIDIDVYGPLSDKEWEEMCYEVND